MLMRPQVRFEDVSDEHVLVKPHASSKLTYPGSQMQSQIPAAAAATAAASRAPSRPLDTSSAPLGDADLHDRAGPADGATQLAAADSSFEESGNESDLSEDISI
jgi:hypothetical protein